MPAAQVLRGELPHLGQLLRHPAGLPAHAAGAGGLRGAGGVVSAQRDGVGAGDGTKERCDILVRRVEELEAQNAGLLELVTERERELAEPRHRMAELGKPENVGGTVNPSPVEVGHDPGDVQQRDWRPPRRQPGMPYAGGWLP